LSLDLDLEDLCAQAAVAMNLLPHEYPQWSDGHPAHLAAMRELWLQVRSQLRRTQSMTAADQEFHHMYGAFRAGKAAKTRRDALKFFRALTAMIDSDHHSARRPIPATVIGLELARHVALPSGHAMNLNVGAPDPIRPVPQSA
jgi:hypothetical protein